MTNRDMDHRLQEHLAHARAQSGSPSLRAIAERTDYSHTTVAKAFTPAVTGLSWPVVEQVAAAVDADLTVEPHVVEVGGTTDVARWVPIAEVGSAISPVLPMVVHAIERADHFAPGV